MVEHTSNITPAFFTSSNLPTKQGSSASERDKLSLRHLRYPRLYILAAGTFTRSPVQLRLGKGIGGNQLLAQPLKEMRRLTVARSVLRKASNSSSVAHIRGTSLQTLLKRGRSHGHFQTSRESVRISRFWSGTEARYAIAQCACAVCLNETTAQTYGSRLVITCKRNTCEKIKVSITLRIRSEQNQLWLLIVVHDNFLWC